MEQEHKTIETATETELKAASYDLITQGQMIQSQINAIQVELTKRYKTRNESSNKISVN